MIEESQAQDPNEELTLKVRLESIELILDKVIQPETNGERYVLAHFWTEIQKLHRWIGGRMVEK